MARPERTPCKDAPATDYEKRCEAGEPACCAMLVQGEAFVGTRHLYDYEIACRGGYVAACNVVLESRLPTRTKLEASESACGITRDPATCRAAATLGFVLESDLAKQHLASYCDHSVSAHLELGEGALACTSPDANIFGRVTGDADACRDGAYERCLALAGADANIARLLEWVAMDAWMMRGYSSAQATTILASRVTPATPSPPATKGFSSVTVSPEDSPLRGGENDRRGIGAVTRAIRAREAELDRCRAFESHAPGTVAGAQTTTFDAVIDDRGVIVAAVPIDRPTLVVPTELAGGRAVTGGAPSLADCVRGVVQDTPIQGIEQAGQARVHITLSP